MPDKFTPQAKQTLTFAQEEAHNLHHTYIGTEHVLLALLQNDTAFESTILTSLGLTAAKVREQIAALIHTGPASTPKTDIPYTPRANRVLQFAREEAQIHSQKQISNEHLLLGLLREPDGVASQVLANLGLDINHARRELLKTRIEQMKIVERAIRPVHAATARKRKMREELLAHLTAIYEQELAQRKTPASALHEAAIRFGSPAELAREFEIALTPRERRQYRAERHFAWRPPESAARYMARCAFSLGVLMSLFAIPMAMFSCVLLGWSALFGDAIRGLAWFILLLTANVFAVGFLYFKMRDAIWGVFGTRQSRLRTFLLGLLLALIITVSGPILYMTAHWQLSAGTNMLLPYAILGPIAALVIALIARLKGPTEIRDTTWACLNLQPAE